MATQSMFTKLIVGDEAAQAAYYGAVYGLKPIYKAEGLSDGEPYREVILAMGDTMASGTLVMFNYTNRSKPRDQQVILGFVTDDVEALAERVVANGGKLVGPIRDEPEHGVRVFFATDPENALSENVQMLATPA
jgi:predicted enzyme related to lactoylglutathione lyase